MNTLITAFSPLPPPRVRGKIEVSMRGAAGGGNNEGKEERINPGEAKPPIFPLRDTKRNSSMRNPKWMMEEIGCSRREEGGAVGGRPPADRQPHMPIGAYESEDIPNNPVARHN